MKKYFIITLTLFIFLFTFSLFTNKLLSAPPASGLQDVKGWAWSSNIGWISFSSTNNPSSGGGGPYSVKINVQGNTGTFEGYAWSSNIGWISFNEDNGCPNGGTHCQAEVALNPSPSIISGKVTGWARACAGTVNGDCTGGSRTDGWDGWIQLSDTTQGNYTAKHPSPDQSGQGGVTLDMTNGAFKGYAWGGDVVGWISFAANTHVGAVVTCDGCVGGVSSVLTFEVNDPLNGWGAVATIDSGESTNISWTMSNLDDYNCVTSGSWENISGNLNGTGVYSNAISSRISLNRNTPYYFSFINTTGSSVISKTLSISCLKNITREIKDGLIRIDIRPSLINTINSCTAPINATLCPGTAINGTGYTLNESCPSPVGICQYTCISPLRINANRTACIKPGAIQEF